MTEGTLRGLVWLGLMAAAAAAGAWLALSPSPVTLLVALDVAVLGLTWFVCQRGDR